MEEIEKKTGYTFKDRKLIETALTHSSYSREKGKTDENNERLEFLGDAFLDAIIGEQLFHMFPDREEGFLSKARATLVCEKTLADVARRLALGESMRFGYGEKKSGGKDRSSILADAVEAIIGAIYIDGGYEAAKAAVLNIMDEELLLARSGQFSITDYKTRLQEILQAEGIPVDQVKYIDAGESGPDHDKIFTVRLEVCGKVEAEEKGKSKKEAQQACAETAIVRRENAV